MASAKDIRRRIKGVRSIGKITRAMEMISAVKMRKAVDRALMIRPYAESVLAVLHQLSLVQPLEQHPLLTERPINKQLYLIIASNRGLCGAFNAQIAKKVRQVLKEDASREAVFVTVGKKADAIVRRVGGSIVASYPDVLGTPNAELMRPIAQSVIAEFEFGRVDRVVMIYTDFKSAILQEVKVRALLPVTEKDVQKALHEIDHGPIVSHEPLSAEYLIEPTPKKVLWKMIPRLLEMELYHAILESNASQEAARMMAMRNATDAAKDIASDLTLMYNQIRQSKITQEIAELSAGMAAVSR